MAPPLASGSPPRADAGARATTDAATRGARMQRAVPSSASLARAWRAAARSTPLVLLYRSVLSYGAHACGVFAGSIAFFGLLSVFPLILLLVDLVSILVRSSDASTIVLGRFTAFFPSTADALVRVIDTVTSSRPTVVSVGLLGLLWSSMGVFTTMGYALNRVWNAPRDRHLLVQYAMSAGLALSVGVVVIASLVGSAVVNLLHLISETLRVVGVPPLDRVVVVIPNVVDMLTVAAAAAILYRVLPNVRVDWREVVAPAAIMAVLWEGAKLGFAWYLGAVAHPDRLYGPFAAIAGLMLWFFLSAVLLLFGAELSHQIALVRAERGLRPPLR